MTEEREVDGSEVGRSQGRGVPCLGVRRGSRYGPCTRGRDCGKRRRGGCRLGKVRDN